MRSLILSLLILAAVPAWADNLTIGRIFSDPALSGPRVRGLQIAPDGARVTFLKGRPDNQFQLDLWEFNLKDQATRRLVDSTVLAPQEKLSDAEQARRERARSASFKGIASYSWSPDGRQMLIPLGGSLYLVDVRAPDKPRKVASGDLLDPQISPQGRYVSFVRDQNLCVVDLKTGKEKRLTQDGKGTIHNAEAEFVAQEEMDQRSGYWWAPDDSAIAFKKFDEKPVTIQKRFEVQADRTDVVEQRYPAAGQPNVLVSLAVVSPVTGVVRPISLGTEKDIYLVRADWSADSQQVFFQVQTRNQKQLQLRAAAVGALQPRVVVDEQSTTWVSILDEPHFLKTQKAFLWTSERSGRKHLYLLGLDGKLLHPVSAGEWGIDHVLAVNEKAGVVYVSSNRDAVIEKQVYALRLDGSNANAPVRVTQAAGWHEARFSRGGETFIDTFSDPETPPQTGIYTPDGKRVAWVEENALTSQHPYSQYIDSHVKVEYGTLKAADGQTLYYELRKPLNFDPAKRYPVFLSTYGGPGAQVVGRKWDSLFEQYMAQHGYVVFSLDNRGSARRERAFTDVIYGNLGRNEVQDQLVGIDWLRSQSFVDAKRIGVFGWSYGGFMTVRLLAAASDRIAAGVAVAPVTDWALYDTHYTEQFLGMPNDNAEGYTQSGVFAHLGGLRSPLLLVHGMADDNVLFTNSTRLMDALQKKGIQFELMTYPGGKHGLSGPASQKHVFTAIANFFDRHLKGQDAPR